VIRVKRIGIVAASSVVPRAEFELGVAHLRDNGFDVTVHEQVFEQHFTYAGTDERRAGALFDFASDERFDVIWLARGGYGATRLLPILDRLTAERGAPPPRKLLVGYSDVTALHEYARDRWGWATLHAPMPAASDFAKLKADEWQAIVACARGQRPLFPWERATLKFLDAPPREVITAELIGGNLSLWQAMAGTPYASRGEGKILFFEDIGEAPYRIDRMLTQLDQSGAFDGARAIVLGDFTNCEDEDTTCLKPLAEGEDPQKLLDGMEKRQRISLRRCYTHDECIREIVGTLGERRKLPIATGLPVGHGPNFAPLPLGGTYSLLSAGHLRLLDWNWFGPGQS
jgi:muramoyltetrapeptide carboxypeptidase